MANSVTVNEVRGVTLLNIETGVSHFLDCNSTSSGPRDLSWEKEGGALRFTPTVVGGTSLRLDFAPKMGQDVPPIMSSDLGVYACVNTATGERESVILNEGEYIRAVTAYLV